MIQIILSDRTYENDVRPIVSGFYPEKKLVFIDRLSLSNESENLYRESGHNNDEIEICSIAIDFSNRKTYVSITDKEGRKYNSYVHTPDPIKEKASYKNTMKRQIYHMLSSISKKEQPWGILTGIRPTKLVYEMLERGIEEGDIYRRMEEEYLCSKEKVSISIGIANREIQLLNKMDYKNGYSLYIGIPFCPSTCLYCSFPSFSVERYGQMTEAYLDALEKEISFASTCLPNRKLTTVYLGGGTPTTLSASQLNRLLGLIRKLYDFTYVSEFCVEAGRPDSITIEKLEVLKRWGVDRISINPQTMQQRTLDLIGRKHTVEEIYRAFYLARSTGHDNINMDIIIGLPGERPGDVEDTLNKIKELNPDSLTVHTLAIKRAARLNSEMDLYKGLKAENVPKMFNISMDFARDNNYLPYYLYRQKNMADNLENIGYARCGKEGLYNILIMEEKQTILALGAGAMSKFVFHDRKRIDRVDNVKSLKDYISRTDEMIKRKKDFLRMNPLI